MIVYTQLNQPLVKIPPNSIIIFNKANKLSNLPNKSTPNSHLYNSNLFYKSNELVHPDDKLSSDKRMSESLIPLAIIKTNA